MPKLVPVLYNCKQYPPDITPKIQEIACHFDRCCIQVCPTVKWYSMHTEFSYGTRDWSNPLIAKYPELQNSQKYGIPQLWTSEAWARDFAFFLRDLAPRGTAPTVIEIHPPFSDYCTVDQFLESYTIFSETIREDFPKVRIMIENRCGTLYKHKFILSDLSDLQGMCAAISRRGVDLEITLDIPQLFSAHNMIKDNMADIIQILQKLDSGILENVSGIHLWGKKENRKGGRRNAHIGDLNSYFFGDQAVKREFLSILAQVFDDGRPKGRLFVPEVNSGTKDLHSIVRDLQDAGFIFV